MEADEGPVIGIATLIIGRLLRGRHDCVDTPGPGRPRRQRGFAVLDLAGRGLTVRYVDDTGEVWLTETI